MRDLLSKLDALISETALKDKEDLEAKRKALDDLEADPVASKDPEISAAIDQRRSDLEKEAKAKSIGEDSVEESGLQRYTGIKKYGKDGFEALQKAGREGADEEEKGRIKDKYLKKESFEIGDEFGISFSEDFEIATHIVDILEDGIVIQLDDTAMEYLALEGFIYEDGELVEGVAGPKSCWKGYRKVGTKPGTGKNAGKRVNDCEKIDEYFQFEFPKGKDRGPRDHGTDELERREKSFRKHELAKDGRDYKDAMSPKSKSPLKGKFDIAGPKGKLPEDAKLPDIRGLGYDAQSLILKLRRDVEEKRLEPTRQAVLSAASELAGDMDFAPELLVRQVLGQSVSEGSAHGYNVARYFAKYQDQKKITNWLRTNAGLDKTAPVYFDDADLVWIDKTIVPDALVNPKYKMSDLLDAVKQAAGGMAEGSGPKEKQKTPYRDINSPEYRAAVDKQKQRMDKDKAAEPGKKMLAKQDVSEAEYQGRKVQLGKKMAGDVKKSKVYVKNPQGNVVKVNFGDKKMRIKKSNPARRKSFRARHNCANPGPRHKARYWSCRSW